MDNSEHLDKILRHITHVRDNCVVLGEHFIKNGEEEFGRKLIANGLIHDVSKLSGIEWEYLREDVKEKEPEKFEMAASQHHNNNFHHPEYWLGIEYMPPVFIAEMVADWSARASEFGTDLRVWIKDTATKKFKFPYNGKIYKEIKEFVDLLLERPFK